MRGEGRRPFVNNVYRRSLALAPPPPSPPLPHFPVYNLTRSPLTAALYYLNAWNRLGARILPPPLALCFSHIGGSETLVTKHKVPWEGGRARIPKGKGKGKFARPSRSWAPKFPLPLSTLVTKAKGAEGYDKISL